MFLFGILSKLCITERICGEVVPRRTSEFNRVKGDSIDWGAGVSFKKM